MQTTNLNLQEMQNTNGGSLFGNSRNNNSNSSFNLGIGIGLEANGSYQNNDHDDDSSSGSFSLGTAIISNLGFSSNSSRR